MNDAKQDLALLPKLFWDFSTIGINQPAIALDRPEHRIFINKNKLLDGSKFWIADNYDMMLVTVTDSSKFAVLHWLTMKPVVVEVNSRDL